MCFSDFDESRHRDHLGRDRAGGRPDDRRARGGVALTASASRAAACVMTSGAKPVNPSISAGRGGACT